MIRHTSKRCLSIFVRERVQWRNPVSLSGMRLNHAVVQRTSVPCATSTPSQRSTRKALVVFDMYDWEGSMQAYRSVVRNVGPGDSVEIIYRYRDIDACDMDTLIRDAVRNEKITPARIVPALHCNTPRQIIEYANEIGACTVSLRSECAVEFSDVASEYNINLISTKKQTKPYSFYVDDSEKWVSQKSFI